MQRDSPAVVDDVGAGERVAEGGDVQGFGEEVALVHARVGLLEVLSGRAPAPSPRARSPGRCAECASGTSRPETTRA